MFEYQDPSLNPPTPLFADLSLTALLGAFAVATLVVAICSIRATRLADTIADRSALGEAFVGGVILGAATSIGGVVVSVSAALEGDASYAFSNGVGGIAAQTLFLAFADLLHRRANLEHAAAEPANLLQATLLLILLSLPLSAVAGPNFTLFGLHPISLVMFAAYLGGVALTRAVRENPMWRPVETEATRHDEPAEEGDEDKPVGPPALRFVLLVALMGLGGYVISQAGSQFITRFSLGSSVVGALLTAVATSLPELVTTMTAVRRGALQLAVGGIIGGNTFDTLFLVFSDAAYREGSLYHAVGTEDTYWLATGILMTGVLLAGLLVRQRQGPGRIGVESVLLVVIYASAVAIQVAGRSSA